MEKENGKVNDWRGFGGYRVENGQLCYKKIIKVVAELRFIFYFLQNTNYIVCKWYGCV